MEGQELLSLLFGGGEKKSYALFYNVFSDMIFYPHVHAVYYNTLGYQKLSDDLAQLLPCLDL